MHFAAFSPLLALLLRCAYGKYVEGTLQTRENWAFLARFCFLSEDGQFEYVIEYNEDQGDLNLLLYYDTDDQWPAVYKSAKSCKERESVLNVQQNQIVNLTARSAATRDFSGCQFRPSMPPTTPRPLYTINIPTPKKPNRSKGHVKITTTTTTVKTTTELPQTTVSDTTGTTMSSTFSSLDYSTYPSSITFNDLTSTTAGTEEYSATTVGSNVTAYDERPRRRRYVPVKSPVSVIRTGRTVSCHNARKFRSARERWWFIAISNCNGTKGISINYQLLMTNGAPGDYWHEHFSADEFYILPVLMAFSIAYSFLMVAIVVCSLELKSRQLLHTTYKIFVISVVLQLFAILVLSIVYLKYAVSGNMLMGASETCYLLLLLLLAKGYTVTRGRLPIKASVKLTIFMCLYVTTYLTIFVYEAIVFDPGQVLYLYESPAGYSLIMLRIFAWFMFIYSTVFTLKRYPEKSGFYYPFNIFGTIWFVAGPTFIISANTYIDKWVRESIVWAVLLFIAFGGHLMFLILTMPSVANKNFPYHVRTTQIGIMETGGNLGTSTIEQFGHHTYEPQQTVIIPLTRRTEEIFEGMYNQRAFSRNLSLQQTIEEDNSSPLRDDTVDNVLNWSLAKNIPSLEFPTFERVHRRDSIGSATSKLTDMSFQNGIVSRRPSLNNHLTADNQNEPTSFDNYGKEVPVELFTVSGTVASNRKGSGDKTGQ
ncbi:transmembrane protein 145-like isoform X2 [Cylas formicarius]|uniref:transmembrane protein 145-like isoform X2 n=1 Tax=Cylas formicarius TaxID=197179 RepID=UPI002958B214|nr:transmembrane protein 145-like isoform X2 [Cylas formicarius]